MIKAFVFGKFLPFHKGHEALIRFALSNCDFLTVLVCKSNREKTPGELRRNWIEASFSDEIKLQVSILEYNEDELPNTSESSVEVSAIWSEKFKTFFPDYSLVITSEKYGDYIADCMNIKHLLFDQNRSLFPVSSSAIRMELRKNWNYLPEKVKPNFVLKVVVIGTESTGKSTLTKQLGEYFDASVVSEAGRELISNSNEFTVDDLHRVSRLHAEYINLACRGENPIVIIDTDVHTTISYGAFSFNVKLEVPADVYKSNKADLYLYLNNDVPFVQDGTRYTETFRNALDQSHRSVLREHHITPVEVSGNWDERFEQAKNAINDLIQSHFKKIEVEK